jgi:hypothetical protein
MIATASTKTLTVACEAGLGNRLRVLLSGMALAEASGRRFTMLWPRSPSCSAVFSDLYETAWPVQDLAMSANWGLFLHTFNSPTGSSSSVVDLLTIPSPDVRVHAYNWLLRPEIYPSHRQLMRRCVELFDELLPVVEVRERIKAFHVAAFRPRMIGVHLRRADHQLAAPTAAGNTRSAMAAVDRWLEKWPEAGILLCTDDGAIHQRTRRALPTEGVRAKFLWRYGERVVSTTPRSLNRNEPVAIQDALVDMMLLRQTDGLVGTAGSSFSALAAFGRPIPIIYCRSPNRLRYLMPIQQWIKGNIRWGELQNYYKRLVRSRFRL